MLSVYQLVLPTPYPVGPVNAYLIKNNPMTLIDIGPDTPAADRALRTMLASLGCKIDDIKRIVVTHAHPDHCGLAGKIALEVGASVLIHPMEVKKLRENADYFKERLPLVLETGISAEVIQEIVSERDKLPRPTILETHTKLVGGGEVLPFDRGELQIMHFPGHSPGHLCLYDAKQKLFFSGDFLLPHITPNPLVEPDHHQPGRRAPTLQQYLTGLDLLENMDINMVFPGHGGIFNDYHSAINVGRGHHRHQFDRIKDHLLTEGINAFQLSRAIYPTLKGWQIFLGLSEILAHLDLMVEKELVNCIARQGVNYYSNIE